MLLLRRLASLIKIEHTIFAMPFAMAGMLIGAERLDVPVTASLVTWIVLAMVGARTLAMALNRIIDAGIDARNPRTAQREIPAGLVGRGMALALCAAALALLVASTFHLEPVTRLLWPIPVALFVLYPYTKRFTWLCHLVLALCTGLAPLGAWLATTGTISAEPVLLTVAAGAWIGGFDIIYATKDVEFDRAEGLCSLPARFGIGPALGVTRAAHALSIGALIGVGVLASLGPAYWVAVAIAAGVLAWENSIVSPRDLSRVDAAFMNANGIVGLVFLAGVVVDHAL